MISQENIEDAVVQYMLNNPTKPKFVLLDKKSYDRLSQSFEVKERRLLKPQPVTPAQKIEEKLPKIIKMHTSKAELQILKVDTDSDLFEVVG